MIIRGLITRIHRLKVGDVIEIDLPALLPQVQRLNVRQCAERYGVSTATVKRWVKTGSLPFFQIGKTIYFDPTVLDEFANQNK